MVKLENVAVSSVLYDLEKRLINLLVENECYSVADVVKFIEENPNYNWGGIEKNISEVEKIVERSNKKGYEPEIYPYDSYSDKSLEYIDKLNSGEVLLLDNPTLELQTKYKPIRPYSIDAIKHSLNLTDEYGRNIIGRLRNIGLGSFPRILKALKMYDEQIERQAKLTDKRNYNLFMKDYKAKKEIVEDLYSDIIMYLIYSTKERTIWGKLSDTQKRIYLSSAINDKKIDNLIKSRMINIVSNYTTLPELETVAEGNRKVLGRFIEK